MDTLQAILLGIVQGITEFLPVSSSGHLQIAKELLRKEGKPEAMLDNIAKGKLNRFFKDNTLVHQEYIMDNKVSVAQYVASVNKDLKVVGFVRVTIA